MLRTALVWLGLTVLVAMALGLLAWLNGPAESTKWIAAGVGVSLVTSLATRATVHVARVTQKPLPRLLVETTLRMALPLGFLLAVALKRRELLDTAFLLYFLPFQFITLIASTLGAVRRVNKKD